MSDKTYWYQCQERAMAPGIADGWPTVIPAPHTPNGRLVRRDGDPTEDILALRTQLAAAHAENERLRGALEKMKRTHHHECEDSWYSCPKSEGGCANDAMGDDCTCGMDDWNAHIDAALAPANGGEEEQE